jgi:hypothetical protein
MAAGAPFGVDAAHHLAASELRPEHYDDFIRLGKDLRFGPGFQILIAEFDDEPYRNLLADRIDALLKAAGLDPRRMALDPLAHPDFPAVENALCRLRQEGARAVQVFGGDAWFTAARWEAFNLRREALSRSAALRLVVWLTASNVTALVLQAPDLWHWRSGVFDFSLGQIPPRHLPTPHYPAVDARRLPERTRRIAELRAALQSLPSPPEEDELRGGLLSELGDLLASIGQLDEALRIRQVEELPVYERLGDVRAKAVTMGKIADILEARGELDEALRIRQVEELPVYERLGDVRAKA